MMRFRRNGVLLASGTLFTMQRVAPSLLGLGCAVTLVLSSFQAVVFQGHQFAYRDAGHFYYPLYRVVQQEWAAGRWPLWNPWQNAGTPLLGMPMAAVLYPGKLLYAVLPYPQAAKYYIIAHTLIALMGMRALARAPGMSATAAALAALSYAFGAPVLSQHSNVIYLVGAAWAPWGFRAIHRLAGPGTRWGMIELSIVLALQVLGGDPESAYLTMAAGGLYAGVLAFTREPTPGLAPGRRPAFIKLGLSVLATWFVLVVAADCAVPRGWAPTWLTHGPLLWPVVGLGLAILVLRQSRKRPAGDGLRPMISGLAGAALLALMLTAAQLGPAWEYARQSTRMAVAPTTSQYDFSVEPYRLAEAVWPRVFGVEVPENAFVDPALPPSGQRMIWSPSLYMGAFVLVLALGAAGLRGDPTWRCWLTILAIVSLVGAMGKFAGPLVVDPLDSRIRRPAGRARSTRRPSPADAFLPDGAGSVYGALAAFLPGFACSATRPN